MNSLLKVDYVTNNSDEDAKLNLSIIYAIFLLCLAIKKYYLRTERPSLIIR